MEKSVRMGITGEFADLSMIEKLAVVFFSFHLVGWRLWGVNVEDLLGIPRKERKNRGA